MAFLNRGSGPIGNNIVNKDQGDYAHFRVPFRRYYYIPLDNTYVLMQMAITFIILIVGFITYIVGYKSNISDPITSTKKIYLNIYFACIGILLIAVFVANFISKTESQLIEKLVIILIISFLILFIFIVIKLNYDYTYTREYFEQFCTNLSDSAENSKIKFSIGLKDMGIKSEKEYFLNECDKLYGIFKTKVYAIFGLHTLLNFLLIYEIIKVQKIGKNKERLNKDDIVVYDEEENIKF